MAPGFHEMGRPAAVEGVSRGGPKPALSGPADRYYLGFLSPAPSPHIAAGGLILLFLPLPRRRPPAPRLLPVWRGCARGRKRGRGDELPAP